MRKVHILHLCFGLALLAELFPPMQAQQNAASAATEPTEPKALMLAASKSNNLNGSDIKPWHIKVSFQLLDEKGNTSDEGNYEEFWAKPGRFKRTFTGKSFTQTDYGTEKGVLRTGAHDDISSLFSDLRRDLIAPLPDEKTIKQESFTVKQVDAKGMKLSCVSLNSQSFSGHTYCLNGDPPILRITSYSDEAIQVLHNRILSFQSRALSGDLKIVRDGKAVLTAHVETIEALDGATDTLFTPPSDAVLLPLRVGVSADVEETMLTTRHRVTNPPDALAAKVSGTVVLEAIIGTDGSVKNLTAISGPPMLKKAAVDAVRTWRYRPFLLNNGPAEVKTTINVVFSLR